MWEPAFVMGSCANPLPFYAQGSMFLEAHCPRRPLSSIRPYVIQIPHSSGIKEPFHHEVPTGYCCQRRMHTAARMIPYTTPMSPRLLSESRPSLDSTLIITPPLLHFSLPPTPPTTNHATTRSPTPYSYFASLVPPLSLIHI